MRKHSIRSGLAALCLFGLAGTASAGDPSGLWLTQAGDAKIRVSKCGGGICGTIVWLKDPLDDGKPSVDKNNPNPSKRKRPLIGLPILLGMKPAGADKWSGRIYNSDDGKIYDSSITLQGAKLTVEGCVAAILCGSETWTRSR